MGANVIDLTTVAAVNNWLGQVSGTDADLIQSTVTAFSQFILTMIARNNLSQIKTYSETYNGTGSERQNLRNYPILSVASVVVGVTAIPQSAGADQPGWVIDTSGLQASLAIRSGGAWPAGRGYGERGGGWGSYGNAPPLGYNPWFFVEGIQNVAVTYSAGYVLDVFAEPQTIPTSPGPYTITVSAGKNFYADLGVTLSLAGTPLSAVAFPGVPGASQYNVDPATGTYYFNAAQEGLGVNIAYQYGGTPYDLAQAVTELVSARYRSRQWIEQVSQVQPGIGTTSYSRLGIPPQVQMILEHYKMRFIPQ